VIVQSGSAEETIDLGRRLGEVLEEGDVVALAGELGSGKTWFAKGLAIGLGVPRDVVVTSPSFALVNTYQGRCVLYHIDAYRLESLAEFRSAGLEEYFELGGVVVMEWADRWPEIIPDLRLRVDFDILNNFRRVIRIGGDHPRAKEILKRMDRAGKA
jgi:tRNA threonylcarbamoyladenosine biosynthesis protein TsaE